MEVDEKLFGTETGHHKFKVGFAGCPFDCPKSATNDVGLQGAIWPALNIDECISCGLCIKSCTEGAIVADEDGKPVFITDNCTYCGDCVKVCPTEAWKVKKKGYTVRIGGKWGRHPLIGTLYAEFLPEENVVDFISEVLAWYKEKAERLGRIRIGDVIHREGTESLLSRLRVKFPENTVDATIPPVAVPTQVGKEKQI
jgi:dissimilatory sulfite reductase (desulfoviridin) alpha/beta subunit